MKKILLAGVTAFGLTFAATNADAAFSYTSGSFIANPTPPINITFTFLGMNAGDYDLMYGGAAGPTTLIFDNQAGIGDTMTITNVSSDPFRLYLKDNNTGQTWSSDPGANGGDQHLAYTSMWSDFNLGLAPGAASAFTTFYGWEDRALVGSDHDYNDLVFGMKITGVPEPVSLALFGAGLLGLGLARRRKTV